MFRPSVYVLSLLTASLLAFCLLSPTGNEARVIHRYIDAELGEYAQIAEEAGQRYLVLAGDTRVPILENPPLVLCSRRAAAHEEVRALLRDEDFPAVAWHGADVRYQRIWRVADGKLLWQRGPSR